ncbi:hypothetical protein EN812_33315, partial [Mesorhizobium sp. M4B.F.Ca.ET.169.01.1.1]
ALPICAEWLVRRALAPGTSEATIDPGKAVLSEVAALLTFALASIGSFLAFEWPPLLRKIVLTLLLAIALIASGLLRSWVAFSHRPEQGWGWLLAAGIITILLGLMIAMGWPVNSLW